MSVDVETMWQTERDAAQELRGLSNWGRWGDDDERGALNLVTDAVVARALAAVKTHRVIPLGAEIRASGMGMYHSTRPNTSGPKLRGVPQPLHFFASDGGDEALGVLPGSVHLFEDTFITPTHGAGTHLDALGHVSVDGQLYNGMSARLVRSYGARRLGIERTRGFVTRGILLDVAGYRGVETLEDDDYITADDIKACCERQGVTIEAGDAVLLRTGWPKVFAVDPIRYGGLQPGLGASGALFLARCDVCLVGADNGFVGPYNGFAEDKLTDAAKYDVNLAHATSSMISREDPRPDLGYDIHEIFIRNLGIYLLEMLDLDEAAAAELSEFQLVVAPLLLRGAVGSPVNPLAVA